MKKILFFLIAFILVQPLDLGCQVLPEMPNDPEGQRNWFRQLLEKSGATFEGQLHEITVYGRILDQYGVPVQDAEVEVSWRYDSLVTLKRHIERKFYKTDAMGKYRFETIEEYNPTIWKIKKKGYELPKESNPYFKMNSTQGIAVLKNSTDLNPYIFYLRKLGPTTYLFNDIELGWKIRKPENTKSYDILRRGLKTIDPDLSKLRAPELIDLVYDVTNDTSGGTYTMRIIAPLEVNGAQMTDEILYEAPAAGYSRELTITLNHGDKLTKYLYFTSRNPAVYSRMKMEFIAKPEELIFRYDTWTNPYGTRNLEYEPDMPFSLEEQLEREAVRALQRGKIPPEPDIPALIASGQYD